MSRKCRNVKKVRNSGKDQEQQERPRNGRRDPGRQGGRYTLPGT